MNILLSHQVIKSTALTRRPLKVPQWRLLSRDSPLSHNAFQTSPSLPYIPYSMKFWRHFNLAILAIFQKIAKLKCTKIKCR